MNILGLSYYYHDSAAALVRDGVLVAAAAEERFSRIKHDAGFPRLAIDFALERAGLRVADLDYVVFYEKPFVKLERMLITAMATFPRSAAVFREAMQRWVTDKLWIKSMMSRELGLRGSKILFADHHVSHAASSFFTSPFEEAAILTVDGAGEWSTSTMGVGCGNKLEIQKELRFPHSLGLLYSAFTAYCGFEINEGEYKLMGMHPYGEPKYVDKIMDDPASWSARTAASGTTCATSPTTARGTPRSPTPSESTSAGLRATRSCRTRRSIPTTATWQRASNA